MFAWSLSVGDGVGIHGGRAGSLAKFPSVYPFWWIRTCLLVIEEKQGKNWEKKPKIYRGASFPLKRLGKPPGQTEELKALPCENNGCRWHRGWGLLILMSLVSVRSECPWGPLSQSRSAANDAYTVTLGPGAGRAYCAGMTRATAAFFFFFGKAQVTRFGRCRVKCTNTVFPMNPIIFSVRFRRVWRFSGKSTTL